MGNVDYGLFELGDYSMKHTELGIKHHRAVTGCRGKFTKSINDKGDMGAFEIFRCDGTHTRGRTRGQACNYAGRGAQVRTGPKVVEPEELNESDATVAVAAGIAALLTCGDSKASGETDVEFAERVEGELSESDAPVAELNESEPSDLWQGDE